MGRQAGRSGSGRRPAPPCAKHPERLAVHRRRLAALLPSKKSIMMRRSRSGQTRGVDGGVRRLGREVGVLVDAEGVARGPTAAKEVSQPTPNLVAAEATAELGDPPGHRGRLRRRRPATRAAPHSSLPDRYRLPLPGATSRMPSTAATMSGPPAPCICGCSLSSEQIRSTLIPQHPNIVTLARTDDREKPAPMIEKRSIIERDRKDTASSSTMGRPTLGEEVTLTGKIPSSRGTTARSIQ